MKIGPKLDLGTMLERIFILYYWAILEVRYINKKLLLFIITIIIIIIIMTTIKVV